jgi:phage gpG-like protein
MPRSRRQGNTRIRLLGGEVQFSLSDPDQVEMVRRLDHYDTAARDFSPVFEAFSVYHARSIDRNFTAEGRPRRWAALAKSTLQDRMRQGYGPGPILQRSQALRRGFEFSWRTQTYSVRNSVPYFNAHQYGYPPHHLPARSMLVLLRQDQAQFTRLAREHLGGEG